MNYHEPFDASPTSLRALLKAAEADATYGVLTIRGNVQQAELFFVGGRLVVGPDGVDPHMVLAQLLTNTSGDCEFGPLTGVPYADQRPSRSVHDTLYTAVRTMAVEAAGNGGSRFAVWKPGMTGAGRSLMPPSSDNQRAVDVDAAIDLAESFENDANEDIVSVADLTSGIIASAPADTGAAIPAAHAQTPASAEDEAEARRAEADRLRDEFFQRRARRISWSQGFAGAIDPPRSPLPPSGPAPMPAPMPAPAAPVPNYELEPTEPEPNEPEISVPEPAPVQETAAQSFARNRREEDTAATIARALTETFDQLAGTPSALEEPAAPLVDRRKPDTFASPPGPQAAPVPAPGAPSVPTQPPPFGGVDAPRFGTHVGPAVTPPPPAAASESSDSEAPTRRTALRSLIRNLVS